MMFKFSTKYAIILFQMTILSYLISSFFVNKFFIVENEETKKQISAGLRKFCDEEKCYDYENHSSIYSSYIKFYFYI